MKFCGNGSEVVETEVKFCGNGSEVVWKRK